MVAQLRYFGPAGDDATPRAAVLQTGPYAAQFGEVVPVSTAGGGVTVTLPPAVVVGEVAIRLVAGTNAVTVDGFGSDTIDGALTATIDLTGDGRILACDGVGHWTTVTSAPSTAILSAWVAAETAAQIAVQITPILHDYVTKIYDINTDPNVSGTYTVPDIDLYQGHDLTLTGDVTFVFPIDPRGKWFRMVIRQDAVGGHIVTWPANVRKPIGAFNLTTTANATDSIKCFAVRATHWGAVLEGKNYA